MKTIETKQQNRSKRSAAVLFDGHAQAIQDFLERNAGGDHFEKALFTSEQRLSSFALADVYRGTGIIIDFTRRPEGGPPHTLDMLNGSVRKRDSKFDVKTISLANGFIEASFNKWPIFRMNRF